MRSKNVCLTIVAALAVIGSIGFVDTAHAHAFVPQGSASGLGGSYLSGKSASPAGGQGSPYLTGRSASLSFGQGTPYLSGQGVSSPSEPGVSSPSGRGASHVAPPREGTTGNVVVAEAERWIGSHNMTGMAGPWCADAVSFWLRRTGHRPLANRTVSSAFGYGPRLTGPQVGALAVISTRHHWAGHIGVVASIGADGSIRLISGNWGHRVAATVISRRAVVAFVGVK
jgi:uncharacterized protein (TIGR02594 family)